MLEEDQFKTHYAYITFYTHPMLQLKMLLECKLDLPELGQKYD